MDELGLAGKLVATDITPASAAFACADASEIVPKANSLHYIPRLEEIVRTHKIGLIIPLTDLDLRNLSRHREKFQALDCTVMIGSEPAVMSCRDKRRFSAVLSKAGLGSIRTLSLKKFLGDPFWPCFIKPLRGSASHGTARLDSRKQLDAHIHVFGEQMLVQDYVPGSEYTIDVFKTRAGEVKAIIPRQRLTVRGGEVDQGVTIHDAELIDAARTLAEQVDGLWGVFCCQCRRPAGKEPMFFELNPRFGGGAPLSIAAGANLPLYLLQDVTGQTVTAEIGQFTPNLLMLRYPDQITTVVDDPSSLPGFDGPDFK
jgi:carbamoyl-phosphate synthase large subunit